MKTKQQTPAELIAERGTRLRHLRVALRYSREKLAKKCGVAATSIQAWEIGRYGGLTANGAIKLIEVFRQDGIEVTLDWLLNGMGVDPLKLPAVENLPLTQIISQELRLFHKNNANAVDAIVNDSAMEPWFSPNDLVAGIRKFDDEIDDLIGSPCIVQLANGQILIRLLEEGNKSNCYTLKGINPTTSDLTDINLFSAARIIWHRRPN